MPIDPDLLRILICPRTHKPLREASDVELEAVNARIQGGRAVTYGGESVSQRVLEGLVPEGEPVIYPIQEGIPVLLVNEAIGLKAPAGSGS